MCFYGPLKKFDDSQKEKVVLKGGGDQSIVDSSFELAANIT